MGCLAIADPTGHVEIEWCENEIRIELAPSDHEIANDRERTIAESLISKCLDRGFTAFVVNEIEGEKPFLPDGDPWTLASEMPGWSGVIVLKMTESLVRDMIQVVIASDALAHHIIYHVDSRTGKGELIQKSEFVPQADSELVAAGPQAGG